MIKRVLAFLGLLIFLILPHNAAERDTLDLKGEWTYRLVNAPLSIPGEGYINLPATLDETHKSVYNPESENTSQLRREFSFIGTAVYSKNIDIPENWAGKNISLVMERTKPSTIKIDGKTIGSNSRISSPQKYDLTKVLSPGNHLLEIIVNNSDSIPPIVARSSNAVSEASQTNWNGILGDFLLEARNPFHIKNIIIDDQEIPERLNIKVDFSSPSSQNYTLLTKINDKSLGKKKINMGSLSFNLDLSPEDYELWNSSNPNLHELEFEILDSNNKLIDSFHITTGFRNFNSSDKYFSINGQPIFLRGTVNSAVFPLSAYAPVDIEYWINYFSILKDYGINHVRFHSWTPPEAAFIAADQLGFYILTELPIWGELDRDLIFHNRFLKEEMKGVMETYAHHPSFVMFSPGNELWGDITLMGEYMNQAKELNPRILSTYGSNVYLGMNGQIGGEDFLLSSKTGDTSDKFIRGSVSFADSSSGGHFNSSYPNSIFNFSNATEGISVPIISHEVGQYQSYPDFSETEKYLGNLKADNLKIFKDNLESAGLLRKANKFHEASGKWAAKLYKAEMELAQRSPGISGYELFGLQDYPGQGTALIGMLNPFLESKGFISPEVWRMSSNDLMIIAEFPKFTFYEEEVVEIPVLKINFTDNPDKLKNIKWSTGFLDGELNSISSTGVNKNDTITLQMPQVSYPQKMTLSLMSDEGDIQNFYDFWVYPQDLPEINNVSITNNLTEALILLDQGERVIFCPDSATVANASLGPLFTSDFWNYRMYRSICDEMHLTPSPGTLGLYVNKNHPSLKKFPTDIHTDWQWYPIIANSRPLIIDRLPKNFDPIVEVIDNIERNFHLSLMLECKVGKGKLIILSSDLEKISSYPEGKWLLQSIKEYASGKEFKPSLTLSPTQLVNLVTKPSTARRIKELKNENYNSKWVE